MTEAATILRELRSLGVTVKLKDGVPVLSGATGKLTGVLRARLKEHREEVIAEVAWREHPLPSGPLFPADDVLRRQCNNDSSFARISTEGD